MLEVVQYTRCFNLQYPFAIVQFAACIRKMALLIIGLDMNILSFIGFLVRVELMLDLLYFLVDVNLLPGNMHNNMALYYCVQDLASSSIEVSRSAAMVNQPNTSVLLLHSRNSSI